MSPTPSRGSTPSRSGPRPSTHTATRPSISSDAATRGWISPITPAWRPAIVTVADRPGWKGRPGGSPNVHAPTPRSARTASRMPVASNTSKGRRSENQPSPAGPLRTKPSFRCSEKGDAKRKVVPTSNSATCATPRARLRAAACKQPGRKPRPKESLFRPEGVRDGNCVVVPEQVEIFLRDERHRADLAQPRADERVLRACREGGVVRQPARVRSARQGRAHPVVALDAHDLLDQIDLVVDIGPVPGHLDLDRLGRRPVRHAQRVEDDGGIRGLHRVAQQRGGPRRPDRDPVPGGRCARPARSRGQPRRPPTRSSGPRSGRRPARVPRGRCPARSDATPPSADPGGARSAARLLGRTTRSRAARRTWWQRHLGGLAAHDARDRHRLIQVTDQQIRSDELAIDRRRAW